jgi:hypothetical protein
MVGVVIEFGAVGVDSKWVFKLKCDADGQIVIYKARLV